jgi:hypothetical protein
MKPFSFAKLLAVGCLFALALPVGCGDSDDSNDEPGAAGSGAGGDGSGASSAGGTGNGGDGGGVLPGISDVSKTEMCGDNSCKSGNVATYFIDPCCAGDACGLDTSFLQVVGASFAETCQPRDQPGELDEECPASADSQIPFGMNMVPLAGFAGCCRPDGKCGVFVDKISSPVLGVLGTLGLGCVDAAPFFPGETIGSCGDGIGGQPGAGGAPGVGGAASGGAAGSAQ